MSFLRSFRALTNATALWAFATLVATGQIHLPAVVLFLLAFAGVLMAQRRALRLPGWSWIVLSLLAFGIAVWGWVGLGEQLYAVTYFFLYLQINKLATARKSRDYLQLFALTFFQVLAAAVSTESVIFAPMLAVYIFLVVAAMMTLTIKRDAEEALVGVSRRRPVEDGSAPGRPVPLPAQPVALERIATAPYLDRRLLAWLSAFTVFVLLVGSTVFWIVPRTTSPNFLAGLAGRNRNVAKSAFSDSIDFVGLGDIQTDPTIVMRAAPLGEHLEARPEFLRIRGTALDYFSGREWSRSPRVSARMTSQRENSVHYATANRGGPVFAARLTLEPEASGYLFAIDQPLSLELGESMLLDVDNEGLAAKAVMPRSQAISYTASGYLPEPRATAASSNPLRAQLAARTGRDEAPVILRESQRRFAELREVVRWMAGASERAQRTIASEPNYLQVPRIADMRVLAELAQQWTEGLNDNHDRAQRIEERLRTDFEYSLDVSFSQREDHLAHFLTEARAGHCEYFATTMALMLRALGIPSRVVNGYLTDEWSPTARRYLVRQEHAHTWVEARLDDTNRWHTFDPTPTSGLGSNRIPNSLYRFLSGWFDNLKVFWYEKYVDFSLEDQRAGLFAAIRFLRHSRAAFASGGATARLMWHQQTPLQLTGRQLTGAGLLTLGLLLAAGLGLYLRVHLGRLGALHAAGLLGRRPPPDRVRAYLELLREVEQHYPRPPGQTPLAYARELALRSQGRLAAFGGLTEHYYGVRFDARPWDRQLDAAIAQVRKALADAQAGTVA
jgi:transglutaminase-like putative cysteine protease